MKYIPDPDNQCDGLFGSYKKMETEASGYPACAWCETDATKDSYIQQYEEKEGIKLEKENIVKNPAFRSLAKFMLNSFALFLTR